MADSKVSDLAAVSVPLDGTEVLPVVQSGVSKKVTVPGLLGWTKTEIDFGTHPVWDKTFTITDARCGSGSVVMAAPCGTVATGRVGDDWAWDALALSALPGTGSFALTASAMPGPVVGKRTIQYQIG
jgi:hypothetical protein